MFNRLPLSVAGLPVALLAVALAGVAAVAEPTTPAILTPPPTTAVSPLTNPLTNPLSAAAVPATPTAAIPSDPVGTTSARAGRPVEAGTPATVAEPAGGVPGFLTKAGAGTLTLTGVTMADRTPTADHAEAKPQIMPPLTGEGSEQTYMQAIWTVLIFILLLAVLYPTAWKNILAGLKRREEKIRGDIAGAEAARAKAESSLKDYNAQLATAEARVRELLAKAQVDGDRMATTLRMQAQQEAEEIKERAIKEIDAARDAALADVYSQTADLATSVAEKILRRSINADDQKDLVNQSLEQLAAMPSAAAAEPRKVIHV